MNKKQRTSIFQRLQQANPKPQTELIYTSNFELLIAVMLSAQATDISVNKATKNLFKIANTPKQILNLGEELLKKYINNIGLFNTKAKNIIQTCHILENHHNSTVPNNFKMLCKLPGVGRKTANVVLNTAFGHETIAVDTHIFRVANRTKLATGTTVNAVEEKLMRNVPSEFIKDAHHWLILHGRYTCTARKPKCGACLINDICSWPDKKSHL